jgi:hypothetical protein
MESKSRQLVRYLSRFGGLSEANLELELAGG